MLLNIPSTLPRNTISLYKYAQIKLIKNHFFNLVKACNSKNELINNECEET
jgi:hypothetical protein